MVEYLTEHIKEWAEAKDEVPMKYEFTLPDNLKDLFIRCIANEDGTLDIVWESIFKEGELKGN